MAPMEPEKGGELNQLNLVKHGPIKVNMARLIEFMLQKTYHDLTVMAELLPRKSDIERKITIIEFATKSRQQFVRLLALVKWAASAERVDKCQVISSFLDQQSFLFVDTADTLSRMARETLVDARLPAFCLPAAVDVLTTETYSRLPSCIRDRIIPADPITGPEKTRTLQRLDQVIQQRLVTSKLPSQMSNLVIADGRVKFAVEDEFEVTLTLMGDDPTIPWRLLSVDFLVQDFKTGDGKTLVHGLQIQYIHQLAQSRLFTEEHPLVDLYNFLHSFSSLLQLEVLHSQAQRLVRERWAENVKIENYIVGQKLTLSYWRNFAQVKKQQKQEKEFYSVSVVVGVENDSSLSLRHSPPLKANGRLKIVAISTKRLCIETILSETVQAQALAKLETVRDLLQKDKRVQPLVSLDSKFPQLVIETLVTSQICSVFVDSRTGAYNVCISNSEDYKLRSSCKNALNKNLNNFANVFSDVRLALRIRQCMKSVQSLSPTTTSLPFVNLADHGLSQLSKYKLFMKFATHPLCYLVMEVKIQEQTGGFCESYYLLKVKPCHSSYASVKQGIEESRQTIATSSQKDEKRVDGFFLKACDMVKLDPDLIADLTALNVTRTASSATACSNDESDNFSAKRMKVECETGKDEVSCQLPRVDEVFSICDARIPFLKLCSELHKAKVPYQEMNKDGVDVFVRILDIPVPSDCDINDCKELKMDLLDCVVSRDVDAGNQWKFDLVMTNPPFKSTQPSTSQHAVFLYKSELPSDNSKDDIVINFDEESVWNKFLDDWKCVCQLYKHARQLDAYLQDERGNLSRVCSVHSFTYKEIVVAYGPGLLNLVTVKWSETEKAFVFSFGHLGAEASGHQHEMIAKILQVEFSKHCNFPYVIQILHDTCSPFHSLSKLSTVPSLLRGATVGPAFAVIPQSSTSARVSFKNYFMVELHFRARQLVSIRDCAVNQLYFEKSKAPIQTIVNLKAFLQLYKDELAETAAKNPYALNLECLTSSAIAGFDMVSRHGGNQRLSSRVQAMQSSSAFSMGFNELAAGTSRSSPKQGSVLRLSPLTSLNLPVPSAAIPMSPTVTNYLTPSPAAAAAAHVNPAPSPATPYANPIPSPATPYQLSVSSPATPQTGVPSPAISASVTSPGNPSWAASPQLANPTGHHVRHGSGQRMPVTSVGPGQSSNQQQTLQSSSLHVNPLRKISSGSVVRSVLLSHASFDRLMTPVPVSVAGGCKTLISPFEQFLGCQFLLKYFPRLIQTELSKSPVQKELTGLVFKTKSLQFQVVLDTTFTALHLKVHPLPGQENAWSRDDLTDLERFFETKVVCYPYKLDNVTSFLRLLSADQIILKDCIQIIRLELNNDPSHRWKVEWCLTIPPGDQRRKNIAGLPAVVIKNKIVFFIQLTKCRSQASDGRDNAIIIPILYYPEDGNVTSLDTKATDSSTTLSPHTLAVIAHLTKWNETVPRVPGTCPIYPAVLSLLKNLVVPV